MQPNMQRLVVLQDLDERILKLRKDLAALPARLAAIEANLNGAKSKLTAAQDSRTNALKERKKFELDVEQWRERARKYRDQSYEVKTNEAFKALQHEIAHAEAEIASAEDRLLERMVAGEEYDRAIKAAETELKSAESVAATERRELESQRASLESQLASAEAERGKIVPEIPESLLREYDRIGRRHHGIALAKVVGETCQACGVRIRPHVYQELRRAEGDQIFSCETCNRILYYIEPVAAPAAANGSAGSSEPPATSEPPLSASAASASAPAPVES
jgi:uncharacterized protein